MPVFEYEARDQEGREVRGTTVAVDEDAAARRLRARGLRLERLRVAVVVGDPLRQEPSASDSVAQPETESTMWEPAARLPSLFHFFRQLGSLLGAGIGPSRAMTTLAAQSADAVLREIAAEASRSTSEGKPMSDTFARYPHVFGTIALSLWRVGEETGRLDAACAGIAEHYEREHEIKQMVRRETLYPKLVLGASVVVVTLANLILAGIGGGSLGLGSASPIVLVAIVPLVLAGWAFRKLLWPRPIVRMRYEELVRRIPGIGRVGEGYAMARFGSALSTLAASGVSLPRALAIAFAASGSVRVQTQGAAIVDEIERGGSVSEAMRRSGAFPEAVLTMVATGEQTGNLDRMMGKVADDYLNDAHDAGKRAAVVFGVVAMIAVAIYIGSIVIGFYSGYSDRIMQGL